MSNIWVVFDNNGKFMFQTYEPRYANYNDLTPEQLPGYTVLNPLNYNPSRDDISYDTVKLKYIVTLRPPKNIKIK